MVNGTLTADGKIYFSYSVCGGMSQHQNYVNKDWFEAHNTEDMTAEKLEKLAWEDKENSKTDGKISWWGLG